MFSLLHARNYGLAMRPTYRPKMEPKGPFDSFFFYDAQGSPVFVT